MDVLRQAPLTQNLTASVLAAGTTSTISQSNAATYSIGGKLYKQGAAWSNQATPTTDYATGNPFIALPAPNTAPNLPGVPNNAVSYGGIFLIGIDKGGTMRVIQGQIAALDVNGNFITAPDFGAVGSAPTGWPPAYDNFCALGYVVIKTTASSAAWTFGSSNWNATGVTPTFVDINTIPGRPQVS